jgi:hypothetical protein
MMQSPSLKKGGLNSEATFLTGLGGGTGLSSNKKSPNQGRSQSTGQLDIIAEVRALANDEPYSAEQDNANRTEHGSLMMRLKSREARSKAESNRDFFTRYRNSGPDPRADDKLDKLLETTAGRAEELRVKSEELKVEAADAERKLERVNSQKLKSASEHELQQMNAFERSQRRIQEDKREEELQKMRDEAQANYVRVHRRMQNEMIELRDHQVLLAEFRRLRLEKLQENLSLVNDGRKLRSCVRQMLKHGAQRILSRLEGANVPLDTWMREVLVNSCHLEIRVEVAEAKLLALQRQALGPVKSEVRTMANSSKQERFEALCERTWRNRCGATNGEEPDSPVCIRETTVKFAALPLEGDDNGNRTASDGYRQPNSSSIGAQFRGITRVPEEIGREMQVVEGDIQAVTRLIADMRSNAAAVVCHFIREAEKTGGRAATKEAMTEGFRKLKLLVNEDFAKTTIKELQKSAPQGKFAY